MADKVYPETTKNVSFAPQTAPRGAYYNLKDQRGLPAPGGYNGRPRRRRSPCCVCLAWSCALLVLLIVLLGIFALIFYLVVHPKAPKYNVQDVRLESFSINPTLSSLTSGLFELDAATSYSVEARNPNKKIGIYYDAIEIDVLSEGVSIGKGSVPAFYQGHKNTTIIAGDLKTSKLSLTSTVGNALQKAQSSGRIPLHVTVDVRARIKIGSWKSPHFWVHVRCDVVVNPQVTSGSQVIDKKCHVHGN